MKKEVSCRVVQVILRYAEKRNLRPETLFAGVPYTLDYLLNKHERVEWDVYRRISANLRPFLSNDEFEALGFEAATSGALLPGTSIIARLLFTSTEFYFWFNSSANGPCAQLFTCIDSTTVQLGRNHIVVTLTLRAGYPMSREFFIITKGGLANASSLLGLPPSRVAMREIDRGAVYDIYCPEGGGALSWLRRALTWPFVVRSAARELKEANEVLHERYAQLEEARTRIEHQATQLRTAFSISEHIRSNLNLEATVDAVAECLVEEAHFAGAKVEVHSKTEVDEVHRVALKGVTPSEERVLARTLDARGQNLGTVSVSLNADADLHEAEELLDQIAPGIAMEISDALSYTLLAEYRRRDRLMQQEFSKQQIESQEAERKRLAAELHDGLGQNLLVASNELQQFLQGRKTPPENIGRAARLVHESIQTVREISSNLHPHHLDRLGFGAAIEAMAETIAHSTGITIKYTSDNVDHLLSKETEIHMYRIIQEALSNVVRHASAKNAIVAVRKGEGLVEVTVSDDGKGFDANAEWERKTSHTSVDGLHGFGVSSMAERARIISGTIQIKSAANSGTMVHLAVPFETI